jgi:peroxiredoxin
MRLTPFLKPLLALLATPLWTALSAQQTSSNDPRPIYSYLALPRVGARIPDFKFPLVAGGTITPASLVGSPTVVVLWATWCGACRRELADVESLQAAYAPRGVRVVILADNSMADLQSFRDTVPVRSSLAAAPDLEAYFDFSSTAPERDSLRVAFALPGVLVLDKTGLVVGRDGGGPGAIEGVRKVLDQLLGNAR